MTRGGAAPEVVLQNPSRYRGLDTPGLRRWLVRLLAELEPDCASFGVRFTGEREIRALNREYRGKDRGTDVLSFPGEETFEGRHLGDVVISVPTARRQAEERQHSLERELKELLMHGLLHCQGHDHESDAGEMERLELRLRQEWLDAE